MATFLFFGRLNDFLARDQRGQIITVHFRERQSVKHLAESLGVPHPEIGQVQVNGQDDLDIHLGRLAAYLRMLGFDCLYETTYDDSKLAEITQQEGRILLSRDRRLLMRKSVADGYCLRSLDSLEQLSEVVQRFDLAHHVIPFHRCLRCNHLLEPIRKEVVLDRLEPLTKKYFDEFHICPGCGQIYWKGSHYEQMQKIVREITS